MIHKSYDGEKFMRATFLYLKMENKESVRVVVHIENYKVQVMQDHSSYTSYR